MDCVWEWDVCCPTLTCSNAGSTAAADGKAAEGKPKKISRKERAMMKKAQKRQDRAAGSDDEDLGTGGPDFKVR